MWITEHAADMGGDPAKIAIAGESAGGNMAVATALLARDRGVAAPLHVLSVNPVADGDVRSPTYDEYAAAKPLNRPFMDWFFNYYTPDWKTMSEDYPLVNLIDQDLTGLPPTTILNAEIDPLCDEGEQLAVKLKTAGVPTEQRTYRGVTHEFFGMAAVLEQAVAAQEYGATRLKAAFEAAGR